MRRIILFRISFCSSSFEIRTTKNFSIYFNFKKDKRIWTGAFDDFQHRCRSSFDSVYFTRTADSHLTRIIAVTLMHIHESNPKMENVDIVDSKALKLPETGFDGWKNIWETKLPYSPIAILVEFALLGYWNMNGKGRCNPSITSLCEVTNIKSRTTIKNALMELEDSGRWVIDRKGGKSSNHYYPQFVKAPKRFNNLNILTERSTRKEKHTVNLQGHKSITEDVNLSNELSNDNVKALDIQVKNETKVEINPDVSMASDSDPKVITPRDKEIKDVYLEFKKEDFHGEFAKIEKRNSKSILAYGDIRAYDLSGNNPHQIYVPFFPAGGGLGFLGAHWVAQYGARYSSKMSYSHVSDIYDEILDPYYGSDTDTFDQRLMEVHIGACVFGSRGEGFDANRLKVLINTNKGKLTDPKMLEMRLDYEETLAGRKLSKSFEQATFYSDQVSKFQW